MPEDVAHADYPHEPGSLYDCQACEQRCHCRPNQTQCVHCAIAEESMLTVSTLRYINRFTY